MSPRSRFLATPLLTSLVTTGLAVGLLAGCSKDADTGADDPDPQSISDGATLSRISPLTGLELTKQPDHPVLAVKVDNSSSSAPQVGVGSADMVVEELVEGGMTRLATFFHSRVPDRVGPVRSMRATDIGIVSPLNATLVASGGAPVTVRRVKAAGIRTVTEGAPGSYREGSRSAPYNLFMDMTRLTKPMKAPTSSPPAYLPFGDQPLPTGKPARGLTATFSPASSTTFRFERGAYTNTDSYAGEGDRFRPATVLVLRVEVGDAGYRDPAGYPVPETKFTGRGAAMVFHGGRMVRGSWSKSGLNATVKLRTAKGPLEIPPGKVWIELVPRVGGSVTVMR